MCRQRTIFAAVALNVCRQNAPGSVKWTVRCHAYTIGLLSAVFSVLNILYLNHCTLLSVLLQMVSFFI